MTTSDYLTCGQCLKEFPLQKITLFIEHKKLDCEEEEEMTVSDPELQCSYCPQGFMTAWALLVHAQLTHNLKIFLEKASKSLITKSRLAPLAGNSLAGPRGSDLLKQVINNDISVTLSSSTSVKTCISPPTIPASCQQVTAISSNTLTESVCENVTQITPTKLQSETSVTLQGIKRCIDYIPGNIQQGEEPPEKKVTFDKIEEVSGNSSAPSETCPEADPTLDKQKGLVSANICEKDLHAEKDQLDASDVTLDTGSTSCHNVAVQLDSDNRSFSSQGLVTCSTTATPLLSVLSPKLTSTSSASFPDDQAVSLPELRHTAETDATSLSDGSSAQPNCSEDKHQKGDACVSDGSTAVDRDLECCDDQGCGVTVIPGSHQDLQKCCNAVVPKKRKRHMEMKHMPFSWSSSRYAQRRRLQLRNQALKATGGTIYIDVQSDTLMPETSHTLSKASTSVTKPFTSMTVASTSVTNPAAPETILKCAEKRPQSLILKPGAIFSIPFEYTMPSSITLSQSSNQSSEPVSLVSPGSHDTMSSTQASSSESGTSTNQAAVADGYEGLKVTMSRELGDGKKKRSPGSKRFQCDKCTLAFNQRIHLTKHMSKHTGIKPYKCDECDYSTVERSHLKVHIRIHTGEKPFKCTYCEYATAQNSTLKIHLKRHHGEKMYQCPNCEKKFTEEEQFKEHKSEHGQTGVTSPEMQAVNTLVSLGSVQGTTLSSNTSPATLVPSQTTVTSSSTGSMQVTSAGNLKTLTSLVPSLSLVGLSSAGSIQATAISKPSSLPSLVHSQTTANMSNVGTTLSRQNPNHLVPNPSTLGQATLRSVLGASQTSHTLSLAPNQSTENAGNQPNAKSVQEPSVTNQKPVPSSTPGPTTESPLITKESTNQNEAASSTKQQSSPKISPQKDRNGPV